MSTPRPSATGTFGTTSFLSLLVSGVDHKLSGTLIFEDPSTGKTALSLQVGAIAKLRPAQAVSRLGELLVELGLADATAVAKVIEKNEPGLLGQRLVTQQVLGQAALDEALREQLIRRLTWIGRLGPTTVYGFYTGVDFLADWGGDPLWIDPLALIWRYVERQASEQEVDRLLSRFGALELRLHARATPQRFQFPSKGYAGLEVLRSKPQSVSALLESGLVDRILLRRMLYALAVTRHLDLGKEGVQPVGVTVAQPSPPRPRTDPGVRKQSEPKMQPAQAATQPSPPRPSSDPPSRPRTDPGTQRRSSPRISVKPESPEVKALRDELLDLVNKSETAELHELLGVRQDAPVEAVRAAFFSLARKWHPDRLPATLADMRIDATRVFAKVNEAHRVLSSEELRREYYAERAQPTVKSGEHEQVIMVLNAATEFQKAEILAKKHDFAGAEQLAERAYKSDPEQAEYAALYAWIVSQNPAHKQRNYDALLKILDQAVRSEPENVKVHFYRATVLKRAGNQEEAIKEFKFIVSREPNNLEASRELRLHKMRSPEKEAAPKGALFGKLFKR